MKFDKTLKPVYISVFDQDGTEVIKVEVTSFEMNQDMKKDSFLQNNIIKETNCIKKNDTLNKNNQTI